MQIEPYASHHLDQIIYMVAVDPDFQGQGRGSRLIEFALSWMKEVGMSIAMVETGGDSGHALARHTYSNQESDMRRKCNLVPHRRAFIRRGNLARVAPQDWGLGGAPLLFPP